MKWRTDLKMYLFVFFALLLVFSCAHKENTDEKKAAKKEMRRKFRSILRKLPPDANRKQMHKQLYLYHYEGKYLTKSGQVKVIPLNINTSHQYEGEIEGMKKGEGFRKQHDERIHIELSEDEDGV